MTAFYYSFNMTWASISITQVLITRIISARNSRAAKKKTQRAPWLYRNVEKPKSSQWTVRSDVIMCTQLTQDSTNIVFSC